MIGFFQFALSGFWTFLGVLILTSVIVKSAVILILGVVSLARGIPVKIYRSEQTRDDVLGIVKKAMDDGDLDASLSRVNHRNKMRRGA
jgi:hypothetical protein